MNPLAEDLDHVLEYTRPLWEDLRGERLFITGGTGFFGCWLLESFLWANTRLNLKAQATVLTRQPQSFIAKAPHLALAEPIILLEGDVRDFAFPAGTFPFVIHAATESSTKQNVDNPLLMLDTLTAGTRRALDFAISHKTENFLLTSSGAVYGKQPASLSHIPEEYQGAPNPLDPRNAYAQGKRMAEHQCALYAQNSSMRLKIARCFAFVGPYLPLNAHFAVGNFIRDALDGSPITIQGDGTPRRSYLYASDLAIWLWTILFKGQSLRPYNVGSQESISIAELAELVSKQFTTSPLIKVMGTPDPGKPIERYVPDVQRAENELGLSTLIPLPIGLKKTILAAGKGSK